MHCITFHYTEVQYSPLLNFIVLHENLQCTVQCTVHCFTLQDSALILVVQCTIVQYSAVFWHAVQRFGAYWSVVQYCEAECKVTGLKVAQKLHRNFIQLQYFQVSCRARLQWLTDKMFDPVKRRQRASLQWEIYTWKEGEGENVYFSILKYYKSTLFI